jgi:DNA (cytosine-5)-methyltransferase 1
MKVLSLFSGVGGFDMGLENAGMETVFQCEWDKHANSILHKHWPDVPKWDDVSTLTGKHILAHAPVVDVVAWGSPCQDLSVAGKRAGLEGGRSGLFHEGIRIIKELQEETNGQYPRISIWENVVGALNSNGGADFGIILDEMAEAGAVAIEWSVVDAQHWIPQRRKRVFVIAIFDPVLANRCPNPLLPFTESLPGDTKKGKSKRQSATTTSTESVGTDGAWWDGRDTAEALTTTSNGQRMPDKQRFQAVVEGYTPSSFANYTEGVGTLRSNGGDLGGGSETLVTQPAIIEPVMLNYQGSKSNSITSEDGLSFSLNAMHGHDVHVVTEQMKNNPVKEIVGSLQARVTATNHESIRDGHAIVEELMLLDGTRVNDVRIYEPPVQTLKERMGTGGNNVPMLAYDEYNDSISETHHALRAGTKQSTGVLEPTMAVRRLTPLECERLMGWPDDHTRYKADGTEAADTHRYKQAGNGVASPVAQWIAKHILAI